jgi:hypothetical protein
MKGQARKLLLWMVDLASSEDLVVLSSFLVEVDFLGVSILVRNIWLRQICR